MARPTSDETFNLNYPNWLTLLITFSFELSHLNSNKFHRSFITSSYMLETESLKHFLLHIHFCSISKSSHQRCSINKAVLKNFVIFTRKSLCWSLIFNKVASVRPATLVKKRFHHRCFPVNIAKFLRTLILKNICKRLHLNSRITLTTMSTKMKKVCF